MARTHIKAIIFDLYNTLIDIWSEEQNPEVWRNLARFLRYQGLAADADDMQQAFFAHIRMQQRTSDEQWPEVDLVGAFRTLLSELGFSGPESFHLHVTQLFRALSIRRLQLFPDVLPGLHALREHVKLGIVSDAQRAFLEPEMDRLGLTPWFDTRVISGDHGYRKPDPRLFRMALVSLDVTPGEAVYVGDNDYRDICGAQNAGMRAILMQRAGHGMIEDGHCRPAMTIQTLHGLQKWLVEEHALR